MCMCLNVCLSVCLSPSPSQNRYRTMSINKQAKRYPLVADFAKAVEQMDRQQLFSLTESVQVS